MHGSRVMQLFVLLAIPSVAMSVPLTENLSTMEEAESQEYLIEEKIIQDSNTLESRRMCLKAFGHTRFCECLFDEQSVNWNFPSYVQIVTHSKDENDYDGLTKEHRLIYEQVKEIRNKCIMELKFH